MSAISAGREHLAELLGGVPASSLSDDVVIGYFMNNFDGGFTAWSNLHPTTVHTEDIFPTYNPPREVKTDGPTVLQLRAKVERAIGKQIRTHSFDEVTSVIMTDDMMAVVLKVYEVTDRSRRYDVTATGTRIMSWKLDSGSWIAQPTVTAWDDETFAIHKWGAINTKERLMDKLDQQNTCWRPGTSRTPMDGDPTRDAASASWFALFGPGEL